MSKHNNNDTHKAKTLLELGPIAAFVLSYYLGDKIIVMFAIESIVEKPIFLATIVLLIVTPISLIISRYLYGNFPVMPTFTLVIVVIFGALTLYFQDELFIKLKPTILNSLYGAALMIGLMFNRSLLKIIMESALKIDEEGWKKLTWRWALFFFFLAGVNEVVWRNYSESFWVGFKLWGMTGLTFLFIILQAPMIMRHAINEPEAQKS